MEPYVTTAIIENKPATKYKHKALEWTMFARHPFIVNGQTADCKQRTE